MRSFSRNLIFPFLDGPFPSFPLLGRIGSYWICLGDGSCPFPERLKSVSQISLVPPFSRSQLSPQPLFLFISTVRFLVPVPRSMLLMAPLPKCSSTFQPTLTSGRKRVSQRLMRSPLPWPSGPPFPFRLPRFLLSESPHGLFLQSLSIFFVDSRRADHDLADSFRTHLLPRIDERPT